MKEMLSKQRLASAFGSSVGAAATCLLWWALRRAEGNNERRRCLTLTWELVVAGRRGDAEVRGRELSHEYGG